MTDKINYALRAGRSVQHSITLTIDGKEETRTFEEPFVARDFERRYAGYAMREKIDYPKKLLGMTEAHNQGQTFKRGNYTPEITYFGNTERAKLVHEGGADKKPGLSHVTLALPKKTA